MAGPAPSTDTVSTSSASDSAPLARTPLYALHSALGGKLVPFSGYELPVQYSSGIIAEHQWTRQSASLFDVSHMGQAVLEGPDHETVARALEALVPGDILGLQPGAMRYTQLLNDDGGIIDDLMVSRETWGPGTLGLVVNAGTKEGDYRHIEAHLPASVKLRRLDDWALLAVQGPRAADAVARVLPGAEALAFMTAARLAGESGEALVSRSGYTGEDGFEIAVPADRVVALAELLLAQAEVKPAGLGARDSLRLEAGLCLYGHDIDESTSPVEAGLTWSIGKRRREGGGFPGCDRVTAELTQGPARVRVGIKPADRAPAREGTDIADASGAVIGRVTSGGFGPSVGGPIAMGYVPPTSAKPGTPLQLMVRGTARAAQVVALPFVPHRYKRKGLV